MQENISERELKTKYNQQQINKHDMEYNKLISILKKAEPIQDNAEELTDSIMQKIEQLSGGIKQSRRLRISGIVSGVAASALICLFAYETMEFPLTPTDNYAEKDFLQTAFLPKINTQDNYDFNTLEKGKIIEAIIKNKEAQRVRKEQFKNSISQLTIE